MTINSRRPRRFLIAAILLAVATVASGLTFIFVSPLDRPWLISDKEETIEVAYISWMCDCPDFIESKNFKNFSVADIKGKDLMYLEPSDPRIALDSNFYGSELRFQILKVTGRFYIDKGIPKSFPRDTPIKPEHARVFRYDKIEFLNRPEN